MLAGSMVELSQPVLENRSVIAARKKLFGEARGRVELAEDIKFSSPSAAAVLVLGGSKNGRLKWVNDLGQTLNGV